MDTESRIKHRPYSLIQVLDKNGLNGTYGLSELVCTALTAEYANSGDGDDVTLLDIHRHVLHTHLNLPEDQDVRKVGNEDMKAFWEWVVPGRADAVPNDGDTAFSIALADGMKRVDVPNIDDFILGRLKLGSCGHFLSVALFGPLHGGWFSAEGTSNGTAEALLLAAGGLRTRDNRYEIKQSGTRRKTILLEQYGFDAYNKSRLGRAYCRFNSLVVCAVNTLVRARRSSYAELALCQDPECKRLIDLNDHDSPYAVVSDGVRHSGCEIEPGSGMAEDGTFSAEDRAEADSARTQTTGSPVSAKRSAAAFDGARKRARTVIVE